MVRRGSIATTVAVVASSAAFAASAFAGGGPGGHGHGPGGGPPGHGHGHGHGGGDHGQPTYLNPRAPIPKRVNDLVRRMTLAEKIGQMTQAERASLTPDDS